MPYRYYYPPPVRPGLKRRRSVSVGRLGGRTMSYAAVGQVDTGWGDKGSEVGTAWQQMSDCLIAGGKWTGSECIMPGPAAPPPGTGPPPPPGGQPPVASGLCLDKQIFIPPPPGAPYCRSDCPPGSTTYVEPSTTQRYCLDKYWSMPVPGVPGPGVPGIPGTPPSMPPPVQPPTPTPPPLTKTTTEKATILGLPPLALAAVAGAVGLLVIAGLSKRKKGAAK